ncbi:MAG: S41 family peptidase [Deltaproteobacteria bacterium]|nr:S41 family peptidase [Deltaproteobacteria bacterium]MBW2070217.1 S41 family peptidase [Deltaproteobacteria bacterium]
MSRSKLHLPIVLFLLVVVVLVIGWERLSVQDVSAEAKDVYEQLQVFSDALDIIQENYVKEVDQEKLIDGAISGMLKTLDPHSSYLNQDAYKELQVETKGSFGGIGIEITIRDGVLTVVSPLEGTPAYELGIQAGDQILKVDGEPTKDMSLMEAVKKMRGPKGTKVTLTIMRKGFTKPKEFTVIRAIIPIKSVRAKSMGSGIGYVRISQFQSTTTKDLRNALDSLEKELKPMRGLILDLRNNPGGLLDQAVKVSDEFLDEGLIVYTGGRIKSQDMEFRAHKNMHPHPYPLVALVNEGSASAAEIVAGALQDQKRAVILGVKTFGKGSVQTVIPLRNGSAIRLTTALYYTPSGRSIQATGIQPDIVVERRLPTEADNKSADFKAIREKDLKNHMEQKQGADDENRQKLDKEAQIQKELEKDNQLARAVELLKGWEILSRIKQAGS